jgi:hypothetical protein
MSASVREGASLAHASDAHARAEEEETWCAAAHLAAACGRSWRPQKQQARQTHPAPTGAALPHTRRHEGQTRGPQQLHTPQGGVGPSSGGPSGPDAAAGPAASGQRPSKPTRSVLASVRQLGPHLRTSPTRRHLVFKPYGSPAGDESYRESDSEDGHGAAATRPTGLAPERGPQAAALPQRAQRSQSQPAALAGPTAAAAAAAAGQAPSEPASFGLSWRSKSQSAVSFADGGADGGAASGAGQGAERSARSQGDLGVASSGLSFSNLVRKHGPHWVNKLLLKEGQAKVRRRLVLVLALELQPPPVRLHPAGRRGPSCWTLLADLLDSAPAAGRPTRHAAACRALHPPRRRSSRRRRGPCGSPPWTSSSRCSMRSTAAATCRSTSPAASAAGSTLCSRGSTRVGGRGGFRNSLAGSWLSCLKGGHLHRPVRPGSLPLRHPLTPPSLPAATMTAKDERGVRRAIALGQQLRHPYLVQCVGLWESEGGRLVAAMGLQRAVAKSAACEGWHAGAPRSGCCERCPMAPAAPAAQCARCSPAAHLLVKQ